MEQLDDTVTCENRRDLILLYAAGELDADESRELRAHLETGCPACVGALAEAHAVLARVAQSAPAVTPPSTAKTKLDARIDAAKPNAIAAAPSPRATVNTQPAPPTAGGSYKFPQLAAAAAIAACVAVAVTLGVMRGGPGARPGGPVFAESQQLKFVSLGGSELQPTAHGRIFWDKDHNNWHVYVFDLKPPPPGRTYEVWFINDKQQKIAGPTFDVDAKGRGHVVAPIPPDSGNVTIAAITDEPAGGVAVPTGQVQLVGNIN